LIQFQNAQRELDNEIEMNKRLKGQIENYKNEFNNLREELVKKSDIKNELQQKISKLEKELFLKGNQLIEAESKPSQEHYEDILSNYEEMKINFDKAIERIKLLSEENAELKAKNLRLEQNNKKLRKENKNKKSFNNFENEYENKENKDEDINYNNNTPDKKNIDIYIRNSLVLNENINSEENKKDVKGKISIIPEDNDIFGTRGYQTNKNNIKKPRKIQEDGIPIIKKLEEKDNVKDIMVNNYATNDDDYYNRPPIGKPKVKRIKRNTNTNININTNISKNNFNYIKNNPNNYEEHKKIMTSFNIKKNNNDYYKDSNFNENINEDENYKEINNNEFRNYNNNSRENRNQRREISKISKIATSVGVFPSQLKDIVKERDILNLESKLFNM